jgi:hypothetical protein
MRVRPPIMEAIAGMSFTAKVVVQDMATTIRIKVTNIMLTLMKESWDTSKWKPLLLMVVSTHELSPSGYVTWTISLSGTIYQRIGGSNLLR